jgi:uncharacterized protein (TIGR02466 family)
MSATERLDLFATPVLKARVPQPERLNEALNQAIQMKRQNDPNGINRSNVGGWHSEIDMLQWGGPAAKQLAQFALETAGPHLADMHASGKRDFNYGADMWANVNPVGASNALHCHPGATWSGVYYVDDGGAEQDGNGGELILEDPRYPMAYMGVPDLVLKDAAGKAMLSQSAIRPEPGLLVLFPSWLRHSVNPHKGDRERISIAINLILTPEAPTRG